MSIEDIILQNDNRGVSQLRKHLPENFCMETAQKLLNNGPKVIIGTGFYIYSLDAPETDGPVGVAFLAKALQTLGFDISIVSDKYGCFLFEELFDGHQIINFPITGKEESDIFATQVIVDRKPDTLISVERCGLTEDGTFLNMRGVDVGEYTARLDSLYEYGNTNNIYTIGVGDGGNEIGMGKLAREVAGYEKLPDKPCITPTDDLIIASVSNWGCYGLIYALAKITNKDLLPTEEENSNLIIRMVDQGAVDGLIPKKQYSVDGFSIEENNKILSELRNLS